MTITRRAWGIAREETRMAFKRLTRLAWGQNPYINDLGNTDLERATKDLDRVREFLGHVEQEMADDSGVY